MMIEPSGVDKRFTQIDDSRSTAEGGAPNTWEKDSRKSDSESNPEAITAWLWAEDQKASASLPSDEQVVVAV